MKKFRKPSKVIFKKQGVTLMKKKRILSWILCAAMLLSLMPAGVFASGTDVVKIEKSGGTFSSVAYKSLGAAVSAAKSGDKITLAPAVSGGNGENISYVWKKDGTVLDGETGATLDINSYTKDDGGLYEVTASQGDENVTVYFRVGEAADENDTAISDWVTAGNILYLGSIAVTAENAKDIIGSHTGTDITGTASFKIEGGVPTLYLDNVTVKDGYKNGTFGTNGGKTGYYYRIYGIYYKPANGGKLAIKLAGTNDLAPENYTDTKYTSSLTYGIVIEDSCTEFSLNGDENSKLNITAESYTLKGITQSNESCNILINGGEYVLKTTSIGIYNGGSLKIENAKLNITSEEN